LHIIKGEKGYLKRVIQKRTTYARKEIGYISHIWDAESYQKSHEDCIKKGKERVLTVGNIIRKGPDFLSVLYCGNREKQKRSSSQKRRI